MARNKMVTWQDVVQAREYASAFPEGTPYLCSMVGRMLEPRRSEDTVRQMLRGDYDHLKPCSPMGQTPELFEQPMKHQAGAVDGALLASQMNNVLAKLQEIAESTSANANRTSRIEKTMADIATQLELASEETVATLKKMREGSL